MCSDRLRERHDNLVAMWNEAEDDRLAMGLESDLHDSAYFGRDRLSRFRASWG
jgi:hypothetical protein